MSELQFPKDPIVGQEYDFAPYRYYWDGTKWKTKGIGYNPVNDLRDELEPRVSNNESKVFEALRRSYADAGFNLVEGSFEEGGVLSVASDVMITASGDGYSWTGAFPKVVAPGTDPATIAEFVMRSDAGLRSDLTDNSMVYRDDGRLALSNIVFAKDFKKATDTNDIQFIQRAMDYCALNNKDLCISELYQINAPLVYKGSGFYFPAIYGVGGNSGLQKTTNTKTGATSPDVFGINWDVDAVIVIPAIVNQPKTVVIDRLVISGTDTVKPEYGIFTSKCENFDISRCLVTKVGTGILDSGSWVASVEKTVIRSVTVGGYKKLAGTSTHINRCYVDISGGFGFWLASGYSGVHNCAADKTSTYSYILESNPLASSSDSTFSISNCGAENSGSGAVIKILGASFTSIDSFTAFNWSNQQTPTPSAFIEIEASGTTVSINNVRYLGVGSLIKEVGRQNVIYLSGCTTRTPSIPIGSYSTNTKIIEQNYSGIKFSRGYDPVGISLTNEDITDSNTNNAWSGIRNNKVIASGTIAVPRTTNQAYGSAVFSLPVALSSYKATATLNIGSESVAATYAPTVCMIKGASSITVVVSSLNNNMAWNAFGVDIIVYGVK